VVETVVELVGAALILSGFVLAQTGRLATASMTYLVLNFFGAGILAATAAVDGDLGFLLLEGVWATVSAFSIVRSVSRGRPGRKGG
jgi:hypothetical protein